MRIKINGAEAKYIARSNENGDWVFACTDPLVGEFRLHAGDTLHIWAEQFGEWLWVSEADLTKRAVREAERK